MYWVPGERFLLLAFSPTCSHHDIILLYCSSQVHCTLHWWNVCLCHWNTLTVHLWCTPFIMAHIVLSIKCLQSKQQDCVDIIPQKCWCQKLFSDQLSMHCIHSWSFALLWISTASVHTLYNTWYLLYMVIIMYQVYIHVWMKPQLVSIIHEIRSAGSWWKKMRHHFRFVYTYCHMPPDHYRSMLTFQFCSWS